LSTTYKTIVGDTFDLVARKKLGDDKLAGSIRAANPGIVEPIPVGSVLKIPPIPGLSTAPKTFATDNEDEVQLSIDRERFRYFTQIRIRRSIDIIDTVDFAAPFEPDDLKQRESFEPFSFKDVDVNIGDDLVFTGTMLTPMTRETQTSTSITMSCYSRVGVLGDCTMPPSAYPLEFRGQTLKQISEKMMEPWGFGVLFEADPGAIFKKVAARPTQAVLTFLADLAKQRGLIVTNSPQSNLLFWQSVEPGSPVVSLAQGNTPLINVTPSYSPRQYYSDVTGLKQRRPGSRGSQYTVKNPHLYKSGIVRPSVFVISDGKKADPKVSTDARIGRMFGNSVQYTALLDTWRDPSGKLWEPNTTLKLFYPNHQIYSSYEFLIRTVELIKDAKSQTARLTLTLPGAFSGQIPEAMPWTT